MKKRANNFVVQFKSNLPWEMGHNCVNKFQGY
jgi:hypothetical protein